MLILPIAPTAKHIAFACNIPSFYQQLSVVLHLMLVNAFEKEMPSHRDCWHFFMSLWDATFGWRAFSCCMFSLVRFGRCVSIVVLVLVFLEVSFRNHPRHGKHFASFMQIDTVRLLFFAFWYIYVYMFNAFKRIVAQKKRKKIQTEMNDKKPTHTTNDEKNAPKT